MLARAVGTEHRLVACRATHRGGKPQVNPSRPKEPLQSPTLALPDAPALLSSSWQLFRTTSRMQPLNPAGPSSTAARDHVQHRHGPTKISVATSRTIIPPVEFPHTSAPSRDRYPRLPSLPSLFARTVCQVPPLMSMRPARLQHHRGIVKAVWQLDKARRPGHA
ncbi:hypothetical protein AAFF_G00174530 [Aldrovandia affinis]|uniref:Uncharacterized protein n=1 Tax=Aldrovandia affinis TaxID=143900 RepID=A0AAD7RL85_9TELE|nr:hypothetical protein AAFF_G00174530 [Aldrovandia affinis]